MVAGSGRVYSDRIQRVGWRVLVGRGGGISHSDFGLVMADSARRILRGGLHRLSLRTMRRARPVANAAPAGAFDRSSFALWIGGACAAFGRDRRVGGGPLALPFSSSSQVLGSPFFCSLRGVDARPP